MSDNEVFAIDKYIFLNSTYPVSIIIDIIELYDIKEKK